MKDTRSEIIEANRNLKDLKSSLRSIEGEIQALLGALESTVNNRDEKFQHLEELEKNINDTKFNERLLEKILRLLLMPFELGLARRIDLEPSEVLSAIDSIPNKYFPLKSVSLKSKVAAFGVFFKFDGESASRLSRFLVDSKEISKSINESFSGEDFNSLTEDYVRRAEEPVLADAQKRFAALNGQATAVRDGVDYEIKKQESIESQLAKYLESRKNFELKIDEATRVVSKLKEDLRSSLLNQIQKFTGYKIEFSDLEKMISRSELYENLNSFIDLAFDKATSFEFNAQVLMDEFRIPQEVGGCLECAKLTSSHNSLALLKHTTRDHHHLEWSEFCDLLDRNWKLIWPVFWYNETLKWEYLDNPKFHHNVSDLIWRLRIAHLIKEPLVGFDPSLQMSFAGSRDLDTLLHAYGLDTDSLFDFMEMFPEMLKSDSRRRSTFRHWLSAHETQVAKVASVVQGNLGFTH